MTLPDLETPAIGIIGFWNFLDHSTADALDPTEVLTEPDVETWETYDNGVQGTKTGGKMSHRTVHFRVKADGWVIVWYDRTTATGVQSQTPQASYADVVDQWTNKNANESLPSTTLTDEVERLVGQLSNGGAATFDAADVGHYCYEFPNANTWIEMHERGDNPNGGLSYHAETTRYYHVVAAYGRTNNQYGQDVRLFFEGVRLVDIRNQDEVNEYGTVDVLADNLMPAANTVYRNSGEVHRGTGIITHFALAGV